MTLISLENRSMARSASPILRTLTATSVPTYLPRYTTAVPPGSPIAFFPSSGHLISLMLIIYEWSTEAMLSMCPSCRPLFSSALSPPLVLRAPSLLESFRSLLSASLSSPFPFRPPLDTLLDLLWPFRGDDFGDDPEPEKVFPGIWRRFLGDSPGEVDGFAVFPVPLLLCSLSTYFRTGLFSYRRATDTIVSDNLKHRVFTRSDTSVL
mmetsp:Transcript_14520/g.41242  ORF Transcript_14520/g.41242 Transcript_14520/m.41242 type:complete len:208 (-) Transcript_14520:349-972(-)